MVLSYLLDRNMMSWRNDAASVVIKSAVQNQASDQVLTTSFL